MAKNIYPLFGRHRLLKKELLWALRDYSYAFIRLEYGEYTSGILTGLKLKVSENTIEIGTGIVKHGEEIILFEKPEYISYTPTEQYMCLKLKIRREQISDDYILNVAEPMLDEVMECKEDEMEVCRFKLKAGARLRNEYMGFFDIETEFDTVNLVESTWGAVGERSLNPVILNHFTEEAMQCELTDMRDVMLCNMAMNTTKALSRKTISEYVRAKLELEEREFTNRQLYEHLELILRNLKNHTELRPYRKYKKHRQIIVD